MEHRLRTLPIRQQVRPSYPGYLFRSNVERHLSTPFLVFTDVQKYEHCHVSRKLQTHLAVQHNQAVILMPQG
jgi:hypothetical protein